DPLLLRFAPGGRLDYEELARGLTKEKFAATFPHLFLVGRHEMKAPTAPQKTAIFKVTNAAELLTARHRRFTPAGESLVVLAVRKVQAAFPSMITVGRTANNDVVVPDISVSKFHAFFRTVDGVLTLADAGSKNGTEVGGQALAPKGAGVPVQA